MLSADHQLGDFNIDGFIGGTVYYWKSDNIMGETQNGLTIPGYYSLKGSIDNVKTTSGVTKKLVNSLYGKVSASWRALYLWISPDVTTGHPPYRKNTILISIRLLPVAL